MLLRSVPAAQFSPYVLATFLNDTWICNTWNLNTGVFLESGFLALWWIVSTKAKHKTWWLNLSHLNALECQCSSRFREAFKPSGNRKVWEWCLKASEFPVALPSALLLCLTHSSLSCEPLVSDGENRVSVCVSLPVITSTGCHSVPLLKWHISCFLYMLVS